MYWWLVGRLQAVAWLLRPEARRRRISVELPVLWVSLGDPQRAVDLTYEMADPEERARAQIRLIKALAENHEPDRVTMLSRTALRTARGVATRIPRTWQLEDLTEALVGIGDLETAERVTRLIPGGLSRDAALARVLVADVEAGRFAPVDALAASLSEPRYVLAVAVALAAADRLDQAETLADGIHNPGGHALSPEDLVRELARAGAPERARHRAQREINPLNRARCFVALLAGPVDDAVVELALTAVRAMENQVARADELAHLSGALHQAGRPDVAAAVAQEAFDATAGHWTRNPIEAALSADTLQELLKALPPEADAAFVDRVAVEALAAALGMAEDDTAQRLESELLDLASRLVDAGAPVEGAGLALVGVQFQEFVDTSDLREDALIGLMDLLLDRGRTDQAMVVARATTNPRYRVQALTRLMSVVDHSTAVELAHEAKAVIAEVEHTEARAAITRGLVVALVDLGKQEWARELAVAATAAALNGDPDSGQADALIEAGYALIAVGDRDRAVQAAQDAWTHARTW